MGEMTKRTKRSKGKIRVLLPAVFLSCMGGAACGPGGETADGDAGPDAALDGAVVVDSGSDASWEDAKPGDAGLVDGSSDAQAEEVCNGQDDDGDGLTDEGLEASCGACGRPYDRAVDAPYPISGTWMFGRDACGWQDALEAFHRQGGEWVWQFGPSFDRPSEADFRADPEFSSCTDNGRPCLDQALDDLHAASAANQVTGILTYHFGDAFSDAILVCPGMDKKIVVGGRTYWRIFLPHEGGWTQCDFSGHNFDLLFVWQEGPDSKEPLLRAADGLGMHVLLGMPGMPPLQDHAWNVDLTLRPAFLEWAGRVLNDYEQRFGNHDSFAGVYQAFEVSLVGSGLDAVYDTYGMLESVIHGALPGRIYALSPYWDVNKDQGNHTVAQIKAGFKRLARLGVDVIAPQDGRGTGKAALFWPFQRTSVIQDVDPKLAAYSNVDGSRTFGEQFNASTQELFSAVRDAADELSTQEGISVDLWVNVEAFESTRDAPCGYSWATDRTDKDRVDWALTMEGAYPVRIVSFMWDAFYTCLDGGYAQSLHEEIMSDFARPIAAWAAFEGSDLVVRGFHLAESGTLFHLTWYDSQWNIQSATLTASSSVAGWGAGHGRTPMLDEVRLPFDQSDLAPSFYVHVRPEGPGGLQAAHAYSMGY